MDAIGKLGAEKVVYVSCNPETLARDARYMKENGVSGGGGLVGGYVSGDGTYGKYCPVARKC